MAKKRTLGGFKKNFPNKRRKEKPNTSIGSNIVEENDFEELQDTSSKKSFVPIKINLGKNTLHNGNIRRKHGYIM